MIARTSYPVAVIPARRITIPEHLSAAAAAHLMPSEPPPALPPLTDTQAWRAYAEAADSGSRTMLRELVDPDAFAVTQRNAEGAQVFDITPPVSHDEIVIFDTHGGGLFLGAGDVCELMGMYTAQRLGRRTWTVDYRMPPDHPYPAGLDDCVAAYRGLLRAHPSGKIVVHGMSAGGNLAAALILRAREERLSMPAGLVLGTPEVDLTESGDSFRTNLGVDPVLGSVMPANLLYANGHDLAKPYLSPLFADLTGFPPTLLTTGTRDLYLSNTVRMHRALRAADVPAELHVLEAGAHRGFPGAPEDAQILAEIHRFITAVTQAEKRGTQSRRPRGIA